jgi:hypothetical protein
MITKILNENHIGKRVQVTGDRGVGKYEVKLLKPYTGPDVEPDEQIFVSKITKLIDNRYKYNIGDEVMVVKGAYTQVGPDIFGGIDPFIGEDE